MASIQTRVRRDGSKHYIVKWKNAADGGYRSKGGFQTKRDAENWAAIELEPKRRRGISITPNAGKMLFREAATAWLASRHDLKETTRASYADALAPTGDHTVKRHKKLAGLRIDEVFGDTRLDEFTRADISDWVARMVEAGKAPSTIRNSYFLVRQVLAQAVADGRLDTNAADYVKLPTNHSTGHAQAVDDPTQFLTAAQVSALAAATPWPFNVYTHLAAWTGLRAAELAGLQVGDVALPPVSVNPNARAKPGSVRVQRTIAWNGSEPLTVAPKTKGSRRTVPLTTTTTAMLRDYLAVHPQADDPTAPLFPNVKLRPPRPTGVPNVAEPWTHNPLRQDPGIEPGSPKKIAGRQAKAIAALTVAEAGERLLLDWHLPVRHATFYKAVFRPAVLRTIRVTPAAKLPPTISWHGLRHTYASLCIAAGRPPLEVARFMGHAKVTTTLSVYAHLYADDHSDAMDALGAMEVEPDYGPNVIPLRG